MILNCLTIDDEPLALGLINSFVEVTPFLNPSASFSSAVEAMKALESMPVNLIFLDIQMPKLNGIELAKLVQHVQGQEKPRVIFTTAYNQFAVESYRVEALDYLLKPFEYDEFLKASRKALAWYEKLNERAIQVNPLNDECLFVRVGYQLVKVAWDEILYIEGLKDYAKIYLIDSDKPIVTLATLKSLNEKLPSERFMRVQRSFIVAFDKVKAVTKNSLWIADIEITIGEQYKEALQQLMNKWLK